MQQPLSPRARTVSAPSFYLTARQPLRPGVILLAILAAAGLLSGIVYALSHSKHRLLSSGSPDSAQSGSGVAGASGSGDDDDDPSQVDTIALGDPSEAPVPAHPGAHADSVHPFILVKLPRSGDQSGFIPDSPAGHLLYNWLAAFNEGSSSALSEALPTDAQTAVTASQMELRQQTGGFFLLSAKEIQPGLIVFRLIDQTAPVSEALGTLQMRPDTVTPAIQSFSLRIVESPRKPQPANAPTTTAP